MCPKIAFPRETFSTLGTFETLFTSAFVFEMPGKTSLSAVSFVAPTAVVWTVHWIGKTGN